MSIRKNIAAANFDSAFEIVQSKNRPGIGLVQEQWEQCQKTFFGGRSDIATHGHHLAVVSSMLLAYDGGDISQLAHFLIAKGKKGVQQFRLFLAEVCEIEPFTVQNPLDAMNAFEEGRIAPNEFWLAMSRFLASVQAVLPNRTAGLLPIPSVTKEAYEATIRQEDPRANAKGYLSVVIGEVGWGTIEFQAEIKIGEETILHSFVGGAAPKKMVFSDTYTKYKWVDLFQFMDGLPIGTKILINGKTLII